MGVTGRPGVGGVLPGFVAASPHTQKTPLVCVKVKPFYCGHAVVFSKFIFSPALICPLFLEVDFLALICSLFLLCFQAHRMSVVFCPRLR